MHLLIFGAFLGLTPLAQCFSTSVNRHCNTRYSSKKTSTIRTTQFAGDVTRVATQIVVETPRTSVTPTAVTSTVTTSKTSTSTTTASTSTDVYTTSKTLTSTEIDTDIESYTQTVTSYSTTIIQSTTTIAPPVGFTALADMPGYAAKRNVLVERREALQERTSPKGFLPIIPEAAAHSGHSLIERRAGPGHQYPVAVSCTARTTYFLTHTITHTAATTLTSTMPAPTIFATNVIPVTTTKTIVPADTTTIVTVIVSASTTTTSTTSTTQTNTQVETVNVPAATYLAQCSQDNLVSSAVGQKIGTISFNPAFTLQSLYVDDTTGYGCCTYCAQADTCAGFAQAPNDGACYYITTDGRCDMSQSWGDRFHYYNTNGDGYVVGNAQCGFLGPQAGLH